MLKALIITYYWPPSGGSGVQRWTFFAKYLKDFGIEPIVLTVNTEEAVYPAIDKSLESHVQDIIVYRSSGGFQLLKAYSLLKSGKANKVVPVGNVGSKNPSILDKLAMRIRANYFVPDARIGWNRPALKLARQILREHKIDVVITTGPPHSTHLIGLELKKQTGLPWLADFRDPWREIYYQELFKRSRRSDKKDTDMENSVLISADHILTVGPGMAELLRNKIEKKDAVSFVLNGFESELFHGLNQNRYPEFTIAHIGVFTTQQSWQQLLSATEKAVEKSSKPVRLLLVGKVDQQILEEAGKVPGVRLDYRGMVSHGEAVQEMVNADLLVNCLSTAGNTKLLISGKSMEYLASGNEVLILGDEDGDAAQLFSGFRRVHVVSPFRIQRIAEIVASAIDHRHDVAPVSDIEQFSRKSQTGKLAELIRKIVAR